MTMVPVVCRHDGQRFKVATVTTALRCITCGSDDLDLDEDVLSPQAQAKVRRRVRRRVSMETDMPMGKLDEYQPEMGLLQERKPVAQKVRCSTCFYEGKIATAGPLPPCDNCGANTLSVAGPTARRKKAISQDSLESIRDRDPDGGSVYPTDEMYARFETWVKETYGEQALQDYRAWGRSEARKTVTSESKVAEIAKGILSTNPGMNRETALRVARETVRRYPKVAGRKTAQGQPTEQQIGSVKLPGWYVAYGDLPGIYGPFESDEDAQRMVQWGKGNAQGKTHPPFSFKVGARRR